MATNLYEILELTRTASDEQIRKAYRKKALRTHPDRLPQDSSSTDKANAEEQFRVINNAYEVLSDPQKRAVYDRHGVWPPPAYEDTHTRGTHHGAFGGPFSDHFSDYGRRHEPFAYGFGGFGSSRQNQHFRDPFELFNSIFGDIHQHFGQLHEDLFDNRFGQPTRQSPHDPHNIFGGFGSPFPMPFGPSIMFPSGSGASTGTSPFHSSSSYSYTSGGGRGGQWASEGTSIRSVNGVTEKKSTRRDWNGNEHVTITYPDGTKRTTINGVEQPSSRNGNGRYIETTSSPYPGPHIDTSPFPPPPVFSQRADQYSPVLPDNGTYNRNHNGVREEKPSSSKWRWR